MHKGHLDQARANQHSTTAQAKREKAAFLTMFAAREQTFSNQTGEFLLPSSIGNKYIMLLYDFDTNAILVQAFPNRSAETLCKTFSNLFNRLCTAGHCPTLHCLDNECPAELKTFLIEQHVDFQLAPPGCHRQNSAERAICTFKNHLIAGLCSVNKNFPMHLWDRLLLQAELTINLLQGSRINPKLLAWEQLNGCFDFNRTPIAPPGIKVVAHEKPDKRKSWQPHGKDGWYVGPALDLY